MVTHSSRFAKTATSVVCLVLAACDPFTTTNGSVDEGIEAWHNQDYEKASSSFESARDELPERGELHYDIGTAKAALEKWDEADAAFARALETAPPSLRPLVLANMGGTRLRKALAMEEGEEKKQALTRAVEALEKAVLARPDLLSARRDLELALLHLHPPCSRRDDKFEPNDSAASATDLSQAKEVPLLICPGNRDFFKVSLQAQHMFQLTVEPGPAAKYGPPELHLFDPSGKVAAEPKANTVTLDAADAGTYVVEVFARDDEEHPYLLKFQSIPPCPSGDDKYEDNDSISSPAPLPITPSSSPSTSAPSSQAQGSPPPPPPSGPSFQESLRRCPGDDDYFSFPLKKDEQVEVRIAFEHDKGDLKLEVFKKDGGELVASSDTSSAQQQGEGFALKSDEDMEYVLCITGAPEVGNFYQLTINPPKKDKGDKSDEKKEEEKEKEQEKQQEQEKEKEQQKQSPKEEEQKQPIEQAMDQLDRQKRPNLEAQKALRGIPGIRPPGGKLW